MAEQTARDAKLVQYLTEAYTTEKQLETALEAHIAMSSRASVKKRRQEHLRETKRHARDIERRIKKLGGEGSSLKDIAADATKQATTLAGKAAALAQGPLHAVRGTNEAEIDLKNARTELKSEAEEIAHYTIIETFATSVGDKETAQLAKSIRREEERMHSFLERTLPALTKAVVTQTVPAAERNGGRRRRRRAPARSSGGTSRARSASGGSRSGGSRSGGSRSGGSRAGTRSRARRSR